MTWASGSGNTPNSKSTTSRIVLVSTTSPKVIWTVGPDAHQPGSSRLPPREPRGSSTRVTARSASASGGASPVAPSSSAALSTIGSRSTCCQRGSPRISRYVQRLDCRRNIAVPPPTRVALSRPGLTRGAIGARVPRSRGACADPAVIGGCSRLGATGLGCSLTATGFGRALSATGLGCALSAGQALGMDAPASPPRPPYTFLPRPSTRRLQARSSRTPWTASPPCRAPESGPRSSACTAVCASALGHAANMQATKPTATSWPDALRETVLIEGRSLRQKTSSLCSSSNELTKWRRGPTPAEGFEASGRMRQQE